MQIAPGTFCPLIQGDCKQFACMFWMKLIGKHPQTGDPIDEYDCTIKWLPILLIEGSQETRQAAAAIESFRNQVIMGAPPQPMKQLNGGA